MWCVAYKRVCWGWLGGVCTTYRWATPPGYSKLRVRWMRTQTSVGNHGLYPIKLITTMQEITYNLLLRSYIGLWVRTPISCYLTLSNLFNYSSSILEVLSLTRIIEWLSFVQCDVVEIVNTDRNVWHFFYNRTTSMIQTQMLLIYNLAQARTSQLALHSASYVQFSIKARILRRLHKTVSELVSVFKMGV